MTTTRRLAAILAADVAGYSRLMGADEEGTLASLNKIRREIIDPKISEYGGRIVKTMGDGLLLEFPSVVQAVRCAIEVQRAMLQRNQTIAENRRVSFRIGVNLGDVLIEGDDIFGDGVNIAARLEATASPDGLCISQAVYDSVRGKIDGDFVDGGMRELKNIAAPLRVFHWVVEGSTQSEPSSLRQPNLRRDKPSVAVLPFKNMSPDPEKEYFSDGVTEDIITNLSRFKELHVIARNSTFAYKGATVDIAKIGRELKTDYVVEGSVRAIGNKVRITGQLVRVENAAHVWADRFDHDLTDVFEVQDEITSRIATAISPAIRNVETQAALRKHPASLEAWDHVWRGLWHVNQYKKMSNVAGRREFEAAIVQDERCAQAHAWLSMTHVFDAWFNWTDAHKASLDRAHQAASEALRSDDSEPMSHVANTMQCFWSGRMEQAKGAGERALALNPNSFLANFFYGGALNYLGQCEAAIPFHLKSLDLSPSDPFAWNCLGSLAHTYLNLQKYEDAIACADRAIVRRHGYLFGRLVRTSALALDGRLREAKESLEAIFEIAPDFSIARLDHYPFVLATQKQHLLNGLSLAGLPTSPISADNLGPSALSLPDKPSIAVLPFQNMSGDPEQEYFADGMVEEIITALSRNKQLFVIARNSSFTFKGKAVDIKRVGRDLGVRYVLEGSIRKSGNRIRITGQLIEAASDAHLWADKYDGNLEDVFELQDRVAASVVGAIAPSVSHAEMERANRKPTSSLDAYDYYLRGQAAAWQCTRDSTDQAIVHCKQAVELDPQFALAYARLGAALDQRRDWGWSTDPAADISQAITFAKIGIRLGRHDANVLALSAVPLLSDASEIELANSLCDEAIRLDPNQILGLLFGGFAKIMLGDHQTAIHHLQRALRLSPLDPRTYLALGGLGMAHFFLDRYEEGLKFAADALLHQPDHLTFLHNAMACQAMLGNIEDSQKLWQRIALRSPSERLSDVRKRGWRGQELAKLLEAYRLAGMPE